MRVRDDLLFGVTQEPKMQGLYLNMCFPNLHGREKWVLPCLTLAIMFLEMTVIIFAYFLLARPIPEAMPNLRELGQDNFPFTWEETCENICEQS